MAADVPVALLETAVLANVVQVVPSDDDRTLHLGLGHHSSEDAATDGDITGERALLVDVSASDGLRWKMGGG